MKPVSQELCARSLWGKLRTQGRPLLDPWVLMEGPAQLQGRGGGPLHLDVRAGEWWCGESIVQMRDGEKFLYLLWVEDLERKFCVKLLKQISEAYQWRTLWNFQPLHLRKPTVKITCYSPRVCCHASEIISCHASEIISWALDCEPHNQTSPSDGMNTSRLRSCLHQASLILLM